MVGNLGFVLSWGSVQITLINASIFFVCGPCATLHSMIATSTTIYALHLAFQLISAVIHAWNLSPPQVSTFCASYSYHNRPAYFVPLLPPLYHTGNAESLRTKPYIL